ncbi:hypothetical protein KFK09_011261 [Dendrobium nobile]|uniref:Disease resistance protein RGA3 n=1 Tax=Dendrobium nobile TaxID=94219 RepID=A0A8T3BE39_DENNO|nr:hypothetical protein KFK09_011261 [Dendrobium nobile]
MAGEFILSAFLPVILDKLISPAIQQVGAAFGTDEKLKKLKRILESLQSVLVDAEERQNSETSIKNWLSDLMDLAYEAEDVLEVFDFEAQRKRRSRIHDNNMRRKVFFYCSFYKPIMTRFSLCRRLNHIIEKVEAIADEIHKFNFQLNKEVGISFGRPQTHSYVDKESIIGREEDKEDIVSFLINHDGCNNRKIAVLPIVAMGGMGKTTLSQLVYSDLRVEHHFQLFIWVCVSDADFDVIRLVRLIIEAATKEECKLSNMELLQYRLREIITGKRYLIVLDDVWNENPIQWKQLMTLLDCGGEGSTVVVSTRSMVAAKMMATHTIHYLKQLHEEDSWELFKRRAFGDGAEETTSLVKIGKDIIKWCAGLPLAIDALGSMMRLKNDEEEWKAVLNSDIWKMQAAKDNILPALKVSYNYLPSHLKRCFAFCAIYPKAYEMEKETLIQLWMANGYIPFHGKGDLEAMGRDIFDELVWRSFFQNVKEVRSNYRQDNTYGYRGIVTCKMHDLMHDLAQSIMGKECLNFAQAHAPKWEDIPSNTRHLLIPSFPELTSPRSLPVLPTIRTIIGSNKYFLEQELPSKYPSMLKSLRVLSSQVKLFNKTVSVRHLRHLRWLDLSFSYIMELPEGICSLYNLQTLKLSGCEMLKKLPENLTNLVNLRCLYIDGCYNLVHMPRGMGSLKLLHTLTMYIVSAQVGRGLEQLHDLNLGGRLELYGIDKVSNVIDAKDASLSSKLNLHSIKLSWKGADSLEVFEALKPHDGLRMLEVWNYGGQQFPKWMNVPKQLENLVQVRLHDCGKCKELPPLGKLPFLEMLELFHMDDVKYFISKVSWCDSEMNTTSFPSLKELQMIHMENLEAWWEVDESNAQVLNNRQFFPSLMTLVTYNCKKLTTIPAIPSLQILRLGFCSPNLTDLFSFTLHEEPRLPRLQEICICDCHSLFHLPACLPSIRSLKIKDCKRLKSLSGPGSLTKLQELLLRGCDDLTSLPQGMESLTILHIFKCNKLVFLPEDLTKLDFLVLQSCDSLVFLPKGMEGLTNLKISKCKRLVSLPEGLIKLRNLNLDGCDGLMSLSEGVECFTELQYLTISECNKLRSLPKALQQQLPRLSGLRINGHDELIRPLSH